MIGLLVALFGVFTGGAHGGSRNTLTSVYNAADALYDDRNEHESCKMQFFVEPNWALVGFNAHGVSNADRRRTCQTGEDCAAELCGRVQWIHKPAACGRAACLCLCPEGGVAGYGDVDGDDCSESNALCRYFSPNIGFNTLYRKHEGRNVDLAVSGEACNIVGTNREAAYGLVLSKGAAATQGGTEALIVELVPGSQMRSTYASTPECSTVVSAVNTFRRQAERTSATESETTTDPGEDVSDALRERGGQGVQENPPPIR
ncbi:hypothetical protein KY362_01105, partial [Candidatus Woesearchaeota archaeon]|nr:hypothetical protein [Candidatus Woesearchaeota archaeon]